MRRVAVVFLALLLLGCSTLGAGPRPNVDLRYEPHVVYMGRGVSGLTIYRGDCAQIEIWKYMPAPRRMAVLAHELMHAAGIRAHSPDPACYLYETGRVSLVADMPAKEVVRLRQSMACDIRIVLDIWAESYRREVAATVMWLNEQLGDHPYRFNLE